PETPCTGEPVSSARCENPGAQPRRGYARTTPPRCPAPASPTSRPAASSTGHATDPTRVGARRSAATQVSGRCDPRPGAWPIRPGRTCGYVGVRSGPAAGRTWRGLLHWPSGPPIIGLRCAAQEAVTLRDGGTLLNLTGFSAP